MDQSTDPKKRRSRTDSEGRNYICDCGKKYFSYQALYTHKKSKHTKFTPSQESQVEKKSSPKFILMKTQPEFHVRPRKILPNEYEHRKTTAKQDNYKTCDDVFREYLCKLRKKLNDEQFATLKCSMNALRECLNKNSEKADPNYFLTHGLYTTTEKPNLIPNVCNFFISEFLPREYPSYVMTDEVHFIFEFCIWLHKKRYTDLEIEDND